MSAMVAITKGMCPLCNTASPEIIAYSDTVDFRGMELDVENLHESKCRKCGHKWVSVEQRVHNSSIMRDAYALVRDKLRSKDGLLRGHEIAQIREAFGINQREAAVLFGGGYNAFNKYESGEVLQSFAMDRLLRLSKVVGKPAVDFLRDVFSTPNFIVISTTIVDQPFRITISVGSGFPYISNIIHGTSHVLESFESVPSWSLPGLNSPLTSHPNQLTLARPRQ